MAKKKTRLAAGIVAFLFVCCVLLCYQVGVRYDLEPLPLDKAVQDWFFALRTGWLNTGIIFITHISDPVTIVALCAVLLILPSRRTYGIPVSLAAAAGLIIYKPMKHFFLRARPDAALHLVEQGGFSFPSGHSVTSVIVFGLLFYLIRRHCKDERLRNCLCALCLFLAAAIGLTRIYVGVHWPTDVLTGWCIGGMVLTIIIYIMERRNDAFNSQRPV